MNFVHHFWIERQWVLEVEYDSEIIIYVIDTYKFALRTNLNY